MKLTTELQSNIVQKKQIKNIEKITLGERLSNELPTSLGGNRVIIAEDSEKLRENSGKISANNKFYSLDLSKKIIPQERINDIFHLFSSEDIPYLDADNDRNCLDEYGSWSNTENESNLPKELNAPCGDATNVHHMANQTTSEKGSKMYTDNTSAPSQSAPPTLENHSFKQSCDISPTVTDSFLPETVRTSELAKLNIKTIKLDQHQLLDGKYLPEDKIRHIIEAEKPKVTILHAGLGVGKSTVSAALTKSLMGGKGLQISHRIKLIKQLANTFGSTDYQEIAKPGGGAIPDSVSSTIHSLDSVHELELLSSAVKGLCVADEFESIGNELNQSRTIRNVYKAVEALKKVAHKAGHFIVADAHVSVQTIHLLSLLGFGTKDMLIIDVEKPELKGFDIKIVVQGDVKNKSPFTVLANDARRSLKSGLKVLIVGLSKTKLQQLHKELGSLVGTSKIIDGDSVSAEAGSLTANTYQDYKLVMLSPAMTTGISFDGKEGYKHADQVLVHASNYAGTGGPFDVLQAMFRDRKPLGITLYYEVGSNPLDGSATSAMQARHWVNSLNAVFGNDQSLRDLYAKPRPDNIKVDEFLLCNKIDQANNKINFLSILKSEIRHKGATVKVVSSDAFDTGEVSKDALDKQKSIIRCDFVESVSNAEKLTDKQIKAANDHLESSMNINNLSEKQKALKASKSRNFVETETCFNLDNLSRPEKEAVIENVLPPFGSGIMSPVRRVERVYSDKLKVKAVIDSALYGCSQFEGDKARFLESTNSSKVFWNDRSRYIELTLKLLGVSGEVGSLVFDSNSVSISDNEIKSRKHPAYALYSSLKQNPLPLISSGLADPMTEPHMIQKSPAKYIVEILIKLFDVKVYKKRRKDAWVVDSSSVSEIIDIVNARALAGKNAIDERYQKIQDWKSDANARKSRLAQKNDNTYKAISDAQTFIIEELERFGRSELVDQALEYMEPFEGRINSGKLKRSDTGALLLKFIGKIGDFSGVKVSDPLKY